MRGSCPICPVVKMMHGYFGTCIGGTEGPHVSRGGRAVPREFGLACLGLYLPRRCGQLRPALMMLAVRLGIASTEAVRPVRARCRGQPAHGARVRAARHRVRDRLTPRRCFRQRQARRRRPHSTAWPTVVFLGRMTRNQGRRHPRSVPLPTRRDCSAKPVRARVRGQRTSRGALAHPRPRAERRRGRSTGGWLETRARPCSEVPVSSPYRASGLSPSAWSVSRPPSTACPLSASMSAASANGCATT